MMVEVIFWTSLCAFLHTWLFYPFGMFVVLQVYAKKNNETAKTDMNLPGVSVILPLYNATEKVIQKIEDILNLDYPSELMEIIAVSDGSSDTTVEKLKSINDSHLKVFELESNQGKSAAQNYGIEKAKFPILLLTDVDSKMRGDLLRKMISRFSDKKVGCVGAKVLYRKSRWEPSGSQGIYWKIEQTMRQAESQLGVLLSLTGSAIVIRREFFKKLDHDTGDDFIIPLDLALAGIRTVFAEDAVVYDEWPAKSVKSELRVRRRMSLRNMIGLMRRKKLLNPFHYPMLSFSLISHKLLRWMGPVFLAAIFISSSWLANEKSLYKLLLIGQVIFYSAAMVGIAATLRQKKVPVISQLGSFLLTNIGVGMGIISFILGQRIRSYIN